MGTLHGARPPGRLPDVYVAGAPKCGTTSVVDWLAQHPAVFVPKIKEPHYFDFEGHSRLVRTEEGYADLYADAAPSQRRAVDGSVWYLSAPKAIERIENATAGKAKYVVCVRNLTDMAMSLHAQQIVSGFEEVVDFGDAWRLQPTRQAGERIPAWCRDPEHLQYGRMCSLGSQVRELLERVPRSRCLFLTLHEIAGDPFGTWKQLTRFLEIESAAVELRQVNARAVPRFPGAKKVGLLARRVKDALGSDLNLGVMMSFNRWNRRAAAAPTMAPVLRQELDAYFDEERRTLVALIGKEV